MDDSSTENMVVPVDNLGHQFKRLIFRKSFFGCDEFGQIALVAQLCDDVSIVFGGVNIVDIDDIFGVLEIFEDFHFGNEKVLMDFPFDVFHIDDFDRYSLG